jgi:hypothetical protein
MALIWWEKTVEYFFIQKALKDKMAIAPLDGNEERAGDAILSSGRKWILIEFKKDVESIKTEFKKFYDYKEAKNRLKDFDEHHFLIYGGFPDGSKEFGLGIITYFSHSTPQSIDALLASGKNENEFIEYLSRFIKYKIGSNGSEGGGGGGLEISNYSSVVGVSAVFGENKIVECMSLFDFGLTIGMDFTPEPEPEQKRSGPTMSM